MAPRARVLMLTTFGRPGYLRRAMEQGAAGFLLKDDPSDALAHAIRRAMRGERVVDPMRVLVVGDRATLKIHVHTDDPELAMGAVAPQGERFTNRRIASLLTTRQIEQAYDSAMAEARAMDERLRGGAALNLIGRVAGSDSQSCVDVALTRSPRSSAGSRPAHAAAPRRP